jgi:DNA-binding NtrC family response regulator
MSDKQRSVLVVGPSGMLYRTMDALRERFGYRVRYAFDPYEAGNLIENSTFDVLVFEVTPPYTAECRLVRELCSRPGHLPVVLFAGPEDEEYVLDELAHGGFHVVRWSAPLEEFHRMLESAVARGHAAKKVA